MKEHRGTDFTRVFDIIAYQRAVCPQVHAFNFFEKGSWHSCSVQEFSRRVDHLTYWFITKGLTAGERIAVVPRGGTLSGMVVDFAAQQAGLVQVPLHPSSTDAEALFMVNECACRLVITADEPLYRKFKAALHTVEHYHLDPDFDGFFEPLALRTEPDRSTLQNRKSQVTAHSDIAVMYTSGSSGRPKGVVLTHGNVVSSIKSVLSIFPITEGDRVLSFLPVSHIFERTTLYAYLALGARIYFSRSQELLIDDFRHVRPVFCTSVPRMLEKMYDYMQELSLRNNRVVRPVVLWTLRVGERYPERMRLSLWYRLQVWIARLLVLNRWRAKLGGKLRYMAVGAAALRPEIGRLFSAARVLTLTGYGMTEASPYISVNRAEPGLNRFGTVGLPVPGVEIRIESPDGDGEGEIWARGPNITRGYLHQPELTREVLTPEGWLRTGDIGKVIDSRFLVITSRKSELFKTSTGKFIAPQPIENLFCSSFLIRQCLVTGLNRPYVVAVLVPNFEGLKAWCETELIHWTAPAYMIHNIKVIAKIREEVDRLNNGLQSHERVRDFVLADHEWTVEGGDLTPSFKLRRKELQEKYRDAIARLYP
jgi:long-chain acyl-CoA synthetase